MLLHWPSCKGGGAILPVLVITCCDVEVRAEAPLLLFGLLVCCRRKESVLVKLVLATRLVRIEEFGVSQLHVDLVQNCRRKVVVYVPTNTPNYKVN